MLKKMLCALLSVLLLNVASLSQTTGTAAKLKSKIINWGLQKNVTVRLKNGEQMEGRIAEITDAYFAVQGVDAGQVTTRQVNFSEVHRIASKGETDVRKVAAYVSLGTSVLFAVLAVVQLAKSNDRPKTIVFQ